MEDEGEHGRSTKQKLDAECVVDPIVGMLVLDVDEINCVTRGRQEQKLHDSVVKRESGVPWNCEKQIKIARAENNAVKHLSFERNTSA